MIDVFASGQTVDIPQVLKNRDARVQEQQVLFDQMKEHQSLINAKLNIPGPVKNNYTLLKVFDAGLNQFLTDQQVISKVIWDLATGPEAFIIVDEIPENEKKIASQFEDQTEFGRLFDIDVLTYKNDFLHPLSRSDFGQPARKCLICDQPAKVCARSRTHSVNEMQDYINKLINNHLELL